MNEGLNVDLGSFQKLLFKETSPWTGNATRARRRRGLINILGYGMKYLFGTADAKDVKRLANICNELHKFEEKMVHVTEHQLTYIRTLDERTQQSVQDTVTLAKTLRGSISNFSLHLNRVEADLLDTQEAIEKQAKYSAAIREIEMAIIELKFD